MLGLVYGGVRLLLSIVPQPEVGLQLLMVDDCIMLGGCVGRMGAQMDRWWVGEREGSRY